MRKYASMSIIGYLLMAVILVMLIIINKRTKVMALKQNELQGALEGLRTKVAKIAGEVRALKDALTNVEIPAGAQAALDNLTSDLQGVDDLNVDAPENPA